MFQEKTYLRVYTIWTSQMKIIIYFISGLKYQIIT